MKTVELQIRGMHCQSCVDRVTQALESAPAVRRAAVSLADSRATVEFDAEALPLAELTARVEQAGYEAAERNEEPRAESREPLSPGGPGSRAESDDAVDDLPRGIRRSAPLNHQIRLHVRGMHCASCVGRVEQALAAVDGVRAARVSLATEQAVVELDQTSVHEDELLRAVEAAGYQAEPVSNAFDQIRAHERERTAETRRWRNRLLAGVLLSLVIFNVSLSTHTAMSGWIMFFVATPLQFVLGWPFYVGAWRRLRRLSANMDTLIALGTSVAYGFSTAELVRAAFRGSSTASHYFLDSAIILTLVTLGKFLEARSRGKASQAIFKLLDLSPPIARVVRDGVEVEVAATDVRRGDLVAVRPGDKIPCDGVVREGEATLHEAMLTGESMPVDKSPGDEVIGGTVNMNGYLRFEATRVGGDTVLEQIVGVVRRAQESKAKIERLADRISAVFVPVVLVTAIATFFGRVHFDTSDEPWVRAVLSATAVLIVACPCALGLATPTAIMVGSARGASVGILIKDAQSLERAGAIDAVVLDKTGTITHGRPIMTEVIARDGADGGGLAVAPPLAARTTAERVVPRGESKALSAELLELVRVAASLEAQSEHPLARAIVELAQQWGLSYERPAAFQAVPGGGVRGRVGDDEVVIGTSRFLRDAGVECDMLPINAEATRFESEGKTLVWVARGGQLAGVLALADDVKPTSIRAIAELGRLGLDVYMVTGDNERTAGSIAQRVGIRPQHVLAGVRPEAKAAAIRTLQQHGSVVAMVGDGINDAPALAQADLGIALGSGTDVAIEAGQFVLVSGDLLGVVRAIRLSRATLRTIRQNLFWAFFYNIVMIPLAAFGVLHPILAAAAMALSSVTVVSNSLLLRHWPLDSWAAGRLAGQTGG